MSNHRPGSVRDLSGNIDIRSGNHFAGPASVATFFHCDPYSSIQIYQEIVICTPGI